MDDLIDNRIRKLKIKLEKESFIRFIWWVDSSVTAILLHKAIGKKLICVFVDNGF